MVKFSKIALITVVATAVLGMTVGAAFAADPPVKVGIVDLNKVHSEAPKIKRYWDEINKLKDSLEAKLEVRIQNIYLSGNDIEELVLLKTKATPLTDAEKNRIKELEGKQDAMAKELATLEQTKDLTAEQNERMKALRDARKKSEDTGMSLTKTYDEQLKSKVQELDKKAETDLRDAINKAAADNKVTVVVAKEAVLFGGTDITADVIKKLQ